MRKPYALVSLRQIRGLKYDKIDEAILSLFTWRLDHGYAVHCYTEAIDESKPMYHGNTRQRRLWMHRLVMPSIDGRTIDHINGDRLDNRRCNLRFVTPSQNVMNTAVRSDNKSGVKGICFDRGKWKAYICKGGKVTNIGRFCTKDEATQARAAAENELFGEYSRKRKAAMFQYANNETKESDE